MTSSIIGPYAHTYKQFKINRSDRIYHDQLISVQLSTISTHWVQDEYAMSWMMAVLKETIFNNREQPTFVTTLPCSRGMRLLPSFIHRSLCFVLGMLITTLNKIHEDFQGEDHWLERKSWLKAIINNRTPEDFEKAKETYLAVSKLNDVSKDVVQYLQI
jgi:hypothetical protein